MMKNPCTFVLFYSWSVFVPRVGFTTLLVLGEKLNMRSFTLCSLNLVCGERAAVATGEIEFESGQCVIKNSQASRLEMTILYRFLWFYSKRYFCF